MQVTVAKLVLRIHDSRSLKTKRKVIKPAIERTRIKFNVSIAEINLQDDVKSAVLGICCTSNSAQLNLNMINTVLDFIESIASGCEIIDTQIETITGF